jgi:hypothetical protein
MIEDYGMNPDDIRGIYERKEERNDAIAADRGAYVDWNDVDWLIALLEEETPDTPLQGEP